MKENRPKYFGYVNKRSVKVIIKEKIDSLEVVGQKQLKIKITLIKLF